MKRYSAKQMIQQYGNADAAINAALEILRKQMRQHGAAMSSPAVVRDYLRLNLALAIDETVRRERQDDWRGHQAREQIIKRALLPLMGNNPQEVERIFLIIKQQPEY